MIGVISGKSKTNNKGEYPSYSPLVELLQPARIRRERNGEVPHSGALYSPEAYFK